MPAPKLTASDREKVIAFELGHLGMGEVPPGSNNTEPGRWYGTNGMAWCAAFQSWSFYNVLGYSPFPASTRKGFAACVAGASWFRRQGAWASPSQVPKRGWLIFFRWPGDTIEHHIGLVLDSGSPYNVNTVEGNTSDKVQLHHRSGSIAGYGIIDYADHGPQPAPKPVPVPVPTLTHVLHPGAHGPIVGHVQDLLRWYAVKYRHPDVDPGPTDNSYGPRTARAVVRFKTYVWDLQQAFHQPLTFHKPFSQTTGLITLNALTFWSTA